MAEALLSATQHSRATQHSPGVAAAAAAAAQVTTMLPAADATPSCGRQRPILGCLTAAGFLSSSHNSHHPELKTKQSPQRCGQTVPSVARIQHASQNKEKKKTDKITNTSLGRSE